MTTETTNTAEAARALKARHRAMWAFGDYPAVVTDLVSPLGPVLVGAVGIRPGTGCSTWPPEPVMPRSRPPRLERAWWPAT
jgi:hypothetical protein